VRNLGEWQNPAFGPAQIREFTGIFIEKANQATLYISYTKCSSNVTCFQLRDVWLAQISKEQPTRVDVLFWFSRLTLDVIGLAGLYISYIN
jgi:hypothetical protein